MAVRIRYAFRDRIGIVCSPPVYQFTNLPINLPISARVQLAFSG